MIRMEVQGLAELGRQLESLGDKVATKILRDAGKAAMRVVESDMKTHAGFDEKSQGPHMRDSINLRSRTRKKNGSRLVSIRVGPSKEHFMKALAQEFGTVKQVASPFIRPAMDYHKTEILRILAVEIRYGIENR